MARAPAALRTACRRAAFAVAEIDLAPFILAGGGGLLHDRCGWT